MEIWSAAAEAQYVYVFTYWHSWRKVLSYSAYKINVYLSFAVILDFIWYEKPEKILKWTV